ncbi:hypothetical protein [Marinomonas primoryensis]|uniref:Lipoprotein n=1 Tax=Marinomonas primoryensis TaxID=178399 RepID=A0ABV0L5E8_9GAMM
MEGIARFFALVVGVAFLAGCAGHSLTKQQKVDMSVYQGEIEAACSESPKMIQKYSVKDLTTICNSHAERAVDNMESYYLLYNEEKLISTCEDENKSLENECFLKHQNNHYSSETDHFIKKVYPK